MRLPVAILAPSSLTLVLVTFAARAVWLHRLRRAFSDPLPGAWPYFARGTLLSRAEAAFYHALRGEVGDRVVVAMKVRLADIVSCPSEAWSIGYGRLIAQKHIDFVLCDPHTTRIVLAIELDDRSHAHPRRSARDLFVDRALETAGVPLLRVRAAARYEGIGRSLRRAVGNGWF
jgi:hypothetical protein